MDARLTGGPWDNWPKEVIDSFSKPSPRHDHAYAIVRVAMDGYGRAGPPEFVITIKKVFWTRAEAAAEVERLNRLNGGKGSYYFWQTTRIPKDRPDTTGPAPSPRETDG